MAENLDELKDQLRRNAELADPAEAKKTGLCIGCGLPAGPRCYSDAGRREYGISGMCETCFDDCFKDQE